MIKWSLLLQTAESLQRKKLEIETRAQAMKDKLTGKVFTAANEVGKG